MLPALLRTTPGRRLAGPLLAFVLAAVPAAAAEDGATIRIDNFSFSPATLTVAAGTTVTWVNQDDIVHMVAADDRSFRSQALDTDDRFAFTFRQPGEFAYFCTMHPRMTGKVVVTPGPG
jgi:plastocyanin